MRERERERDLSGAIVPPPQCGQCQVFHKLVDNLKLFHELKGPIYGSAYGNPDVEYHKSYDPYHTEGSEPFPFS